MASKGVNKVILVGNLGDNPDLRNMPSGDSVVNFSLATNTSYLDKEGKRVDKTEWHRVAFFGRPAEVIHQYCRKGSQLYVEGSLQTRKWQDKDGNDRYTTEVRGRDFAFLGGRNDEGPADGGSGGGGGRSVPAAGGDDFGDMDENIPF